MRSIILAVAVACSTLTIGCEVFRAAPIEEGARPEVVRAERFEKLAFAMVDQFLEWEWENRLFVDKSVIDFADKIRDEFPPVFNSYQLARRAYKEFPTEDNLGRLSQARAVLQVIYDQILIYAPSEVEKKAEKIAPKILID